MIAGESSGAGNCPICGKDNRCGNIAGKPQGTCWCSKEDFPEAIIDSLPSNPLNKSCLCKACLDDFKMNVNVNI
jgi:hypothetical protein